MFVFFTNFCFIYNHLGGGTEQDLKNSRLPIGQWTGRSAGTDAGGQSDGGDEDDGGRIPGFGYKVEDVSEKSQVMSTSTSTSRQRCLCSHKPFEHQRRHQQELQASAVHCHKPLKGKLSSEKRISNNTHSFRQWPREGVTGVTKSWGPGAMAGSKGAREVQIMRIKWRPGKAKSCAPEGPEKWYIARTRLYSSCSYGQLMI
jgi:hypothetical protein